MIRLMQSKCIAGMCNTNLWEIYIMYETNHIKHRWFDQKIGKKNEGKKGKYILEINKQFPHEYKYKTITNKQCISIEKI